MAGLRSKAEMSKPRNAPLNGDNLEAFTEFVAHKVDQFWGMAEDVNILFGRAALEEGKERIVISR